jgi:3-oxochol-4-en-24-oyl-CoA dehydrogenase
MNLSLTDEQLLLKDTFARLFAKESSIARVRLNSETQFDADLWANLVDTGAPMARVPVASGGLGMSLLDAAIIAEEAGRRLASAPLIEVIVAGRLLSEFRDESGWLQKIADGAIVAVAIDEPVEGCSQLVPGGRHAEAIIAFDGDELIFQTAGPAMGPVASFGQLPLAEWQINFRERTVLAKGVEARSAWERARAEWRLLSAAWLGGLSREAIDLAAAYAAERHQFGRPIGSFQGLAHPLADAVTDVEGGQLLIWKAIAAIAEGQQIASALTPLAWWWMAQSSVVALRQSIRTLGGYGLTLEYDLQLYHRRGTALILLGGDAHRQLEVAGDALFCGSEAPLPDPGEIGISFELGSASQRHAEKLERLFQANWTESMSGKAHHSTRSHDARLHRALANEGLIYGRWAGKTKPRETGPEEDFVATLIFEEWNYTSHVVTISSLVGQVVSLFGSDAAKAEILPLIKDGEAVCSLGFSEPQAGSDVFAARTTAVRDGDEWVINGQKMFTTGGHFADYVLLLARTSDDGPKHRGLTLFIVPTALPGYSYQAVETYQDERTNITFYSDLRIADRYRLGTVDDGLSVMNAALSLEHGGANYFSGHVRLLANTKLWAEAPNASGGRQVDDQGVRTRLARVRARYEVAQCFAARDVWAASSEHSPRYWGSMAKLFITESFLQNCWEVLEMAGSEALRAGDHPLGMIELDHRRAYGSTIYGGTSEVHRSIVAEQALKLPKSRS